MTREDAAGGVLPYPVWVAPGLLADIGALVARVAPAHRYVVITDTAVGPLHGNAVAGMLPDALRLDVPPGESQKTRDSWARLTDAMLSAGCGRDTTVVAVGGGVVGDLAGFVAATFMRGVPVVQVPTTLLAMVDASVGGKTAVDTPHGKNLVGAFHPPAAVVIDPLVLATLPRRELVAGLAEVVKHGVIADAAYFDAVRAALPLLTAPDGHNATTLLAHVVAGSVATKAAIVAADEREGGMRKILNFGHTIGHAVETLSGYSLLHGECVAIGMAMEAEAAERAGIAVAGTADAIRATLDAAGLPRRRPAGMAPDAILEATRGDKKARAGRVEYALPERIGAMASAGGRWSMPLDDALLLEVLA
ncbi:3-dehydroquinate synthase [Gemmatirosa kalamazoonensis]|uniref:3-dehydroquinate synthase n=1 Tax=Gemmatirosa kalamazoonensis TaxID=861299 RepID=W0RG32_9BACT|nr:3-dehydroquinate synthase [Gemmatirosa kalamazoonensis]AHG90069.1 3-dehydroquinate synthase [Gemmatirosa kalamazoonensis]